ncbi:MAG: hypothetical protein AAGD05_13930, partial [Bacteroidota bacterium]
TSINGTGLTELNISNLNRPRFALSVLPTGNYNFQFQTDATCLLFDQPINLKDTIIVTTNNDPLIHAGPNYNQNKPLLQVINTQNLNVIATVGDTICRSITIKNGSFARIGLLHISTLFDPDDLEVLSVSHGTLDILNADTYTLGASDFQLVGNGDQWLDSGEELVWTECVRMRSCEEVNSEIELAWGCTDEICQTFNQFTTSILPSVGVPSLQSRISEKTYAGFCNQPGELIMTIINTASQVLENASPALKVTIETGFSQGFSSTPTRDTCLRIEEILIGNLSIPWLEAGYTGYGLNFNFTSDPDGPGGFDDLDNDGIYNDIAAQDTVVLRLVTSLNEDCFTGTCNEGFTRRTFRFNTNYFSNCEEEFNTFSYSGSYFYEMRFNFQDNLAVVLTDTSTAEVTLHFDAFFPGFEQICEPDKMWIRLVLPAAFELDQSVPPLFNNQQVNYSIQQDTLFLEVFAIEGFLDLVFKAQCDPVPPVDPNVPCGGVNQPPGIKYQIAYETGYTCDTSGCQQQLAPYCGLSKEFVLGCPSTTVPYGVTTIESELYRVSMGWKDENLTIPASPNDPNVDVGIALFGDSLFLQNIGSISGEGWFDSTDFVLSHFMLNAQPWVRFSSGQFVFFDSETNTTITCPLLGPDTTFVTDEGEFREEFSLLKAFEAGACLDGFHLTDGDELTFQIYLRVTDAVQAIPQLIPNFRTFFKYQLQGAVYQ